MDSLDALILREAIALVAQLSLEQSITCDVITELRPPGSEPNPAEPATRCSIVDAVAMARAEGELAPGVTATCLVFAGACSDAVDADGDGFTGYPTDPGCADLDDIDETDTCPSGPEDKTNKRDSGPGVPVTGVL